MALSIAGCIPGGPASGDASQPPAASGGATSAPAQTTTTAAASPSSVPTPTPTPALATFTTPDGSLSFTYPQTWKVTAVAGQSGSYAVTDSAGATRATLRDKHLGARYRYEKIAGLSCDEAIAVLARVERTGAGNGARNLETADYLCFYPSVVESQNGQADVVCRSKASEAVSFEAWKK